VTLDRGAMQPREVAVSAFAAGSRSYLRVSTNGILLP
jgi:hypothetical protein